MDPKQKYFPYEIPITGEMLDRLRLAGAARKLARGGEAPLVPFCRLVADRLNRLGTTRPPARAAEVIQFALLSRIFHYLMSHYLDILHPGIELSVVRDSGLDHRAGDLSKVLTRFIHLYPCMDILSGKIADADAYLSSDSPDLAKRRNATREVLLLMLAVENPATGDLRELFDIGKLAAGSPLRRVTNALDAEFGKAPLFPPFNLPLLELLRAPARNCPSSFSAQLKFIRSHWQPILPPELLEEILTAFDLAREEERMRGGEPGPPEVLRFGPGSMGADAQPGDYPEPERFSADLGWMPNVVLLAKMTYVWLDQLSAIYRRSITRLDQVPDEELDTMAKWGFTGLWLIGVWERSPASHAIKKQSGNSDAIASAYSLFDYVIAADLGGEQALENLRQRALSRGIRLASDMVPNHTGLDSRWTREHPDWFIQLDYPPYPAYRFDGPDLSSTPDISLRIEDGYWDKRDAAVVFQHRDNHTGRVRYIYHGNDGTSTPWNDTAQLNYLLPEVRETVIRTILHVARSFPIIRFDAAMTLAKKHFQRLWFPQPGLGGGIPSRAEHALSRKRFDELFPEEFWREVVDRVAAEVPDTLLLAEAFWLMEGYFVRTLGMHRVYNSAFMNMLKLEENAKYRQTIKNVLEFNPEILQRFVNFMNNPDEKTAVEQFGKEGKYLGAAILLVTMPGLPMFGHGQVEGFTEKYGMEYRRSYWKEEVDLRLVEVHERQIFPLMMRRKLFSGAAHFVLYDFFAGNRVDENVFAYSNSDGENHALIIYHNRFASTAGWIRSSCSRSVKAGSGETRLEQTELGQALHVNRDGRFYYRFRDYATGLEYLRHGPDLVEKGIFVELEAYEYHAFLDFREIRDDDYGTWGKLCAELGGRPVESLDEEVKQIRYAATIVSLAELGGQLPGLLQPLLDSASPEAVRADVTHKLLSQILPFVSNLNRETGMNIDARLVADAFSRKLEAVAGMTDLKSRRKGAAEMRSYLRSLIGRGDSFNSLFLVLFLLLETVIATDSDGKPCAEPERVVSDLGLYRALASVFTAATHISADFTPPWGNDGALKMMKILLSDRFPLDRVEPMQKNGMSAMLLHDREVREFIHTHHSEGVEWFNRERYEDLAAWLFLSSAVKALSSRETRRRGTDLLLRLHGVMTKIVNDAEKAGYRTDLLS
ncbi:MAG: alpha-amylase family glycosyl hydrolase [Geobacteraceae bacterium]|nr:alpha-amylase family glycosyl hydrolase [Geobacteraceae bacterium]